MAEPRRSTLSERYNALVKRVERLLAEAPFADELDSSILLLADHLAGSSVAEALGLPGGRVYRRLGDSYRLLNTFGTAKPVENPPELSLDYPPVETLRSDGVVYFSQDDPSLDRQLEDALGAAEFAAIEIGDHEFLLSFDVDPMRDRDEVLISLAILRHSINDRIRQERVDDVFREARKIQASILPRTIPSYGSFDLAGRNESLDQVGGDFYDFIPISKKILGLTIADVSGHGLPAALQTRDIYMGLRMGLGRQYKIVHTIERLAHIIHKSSLTSRFVSMFYGELELNGNFLYVNAGHPPPFHLSARGEVTLLREGGLVMGPLADTTYERGYCAVRPGDTIVLYTDGIVEAHCDDDAESYEEYGLDRLVELVTSRRTDSAADIVDAIFADVDAFCECGSAADDRTVVVVRYPEQ